MLPGTMNTPTNDSSGALGQPSSLSMAQASLLGAIGLVAATLCLPAIDTLSIIWESDEFYGHGYLIPAVAAFLLWTRRGDLARATRPLRPPAIGPFLVLGTGLFGVLMTMGDVGFGSSLGIPLLIAAVVYAVGGLPLLRPAGLSLVFLALMVPPPRFVTYELLFRLKLVVTQISVGLLQAVGKPVAALGNQILVPGHSLFVADACSGLTSVVTLLPLSCIVAYFLSHGVWRRVVVVGSVVPLAIAANVIRVVVTVELVSSRGIEYAQGLLHESFGMVTYVGGTLALIAVAKVLR